MVFNEIMFVPATQASGSAFTQTISRILQNFGHIQYSPKPPPWLWRLFLHDTKHRSGESNPAARHRGGGSSLKLRRINNHLAIFGNLENESDCQHRTPGSTANDCARLHHYCRSRIVHGGTHRVRAGDHELNSRTRNA